jgi:hypothetical protein
MGGDRAFEGGFGAEEWGGCIDFAVVETAHENGKNNFRQISGAIASPCRAANWGVKKMKSEVRRRKRMVRSAGFLARFPAPAFPRTPSPRQAGGGTFDLLSFGNEKAGKLLTNAWAVDQAPDKVSDWFGCLKMGTQSRR